MIKAIPEGYHTLTPSIIVKDARKAIDFYKSAFGAREKMVMPGPDGKGIMHAEILIGDSPLMIGEETPQCPSKSAETLGSSPVTFVLYVRDADASFQQAVDNGATVVKPVEDMFWGDRAGNVKDPFGYTWMFATHTRDLSREEIEQGARICNGFGSLTHVSLASGKCRVVRRAAESRMDSAAHFIFGAARPPS